MSITSIFAPSFDKSMTIILKMVKKLHRRSATQIITALFSAFLLLTSLSVYAVDAAQVAEGKALFKANCASCHNPTQPGTGPALKGTLARWEAAGSHQGKTGKEWLYLWIKNWNTPVNAKYSYAIEMSNFSPSQMNLFPTLKDEDIEKILLYADNSTLGQEVATAEVVTTEAPKEEDSTILYLFIALLIVLVGLLVGITKKLDNAVKKSKGETEEPSTPFYKKGKFLIAVALVALVWGGFKLADSAIRLGRQQGYQPEQPIRFPHDLHAGTHKIDCQYCHTSAAQGKTSGIPSLNTCMNCHKNVQSGPLYGTEEIAKIYDYVGWDAEKQAYTKPAKPVKWVRIHNLPDHVYFNHSQHVVAGKVACQTCHGPVETMRELYQFAPLSMGWCVNCHRQTEVQFAGNNYYSTYEKLHEQLKNKEIDKVTVEAIGGTECQKCHY